MQNQNSKFKIEDKFISRKNLKKVLGELLKSSRLIAPVSVYGEIVFQEVKSVEAIVFEYENCLNAPKDYMLSNDEVLFKYSAKSSRIKKDKASDTPLVIFGSRPCDTKAIGLLDKFFSRTFEDPLYFSKRKNTLIITLACRKLGRNCFCTSTKSGPCLENGFDVQLIDIGEGFYLEARSSRGRDFIKRFSNLISNSDIKKKKEKEIAIKKAVESKKTEFDLKKVYDNLDKSNTEDDFWEDLSERCQSCGGCLLICPTCSCFHIIDKKINGKEGNRLRSLDACYYEGFTRMAGGYNPTSPRPEMMRRKFYHKLWQEVGEFGEAGCTGCGRCNEICPGNINWLENIKKIEKRLA